MAIDPISAFRGTAITASTGRISGSGGFAAALEQAGVKPKTSYQELEDYVNMTPAQRMRADLLKKLGLTEDDLANMSPEARQGVEAKLQELVQQQMRETKEKQQAKQQAGARQATTRIDVVA
ncbi:hypothetical protein [uncultured Massilia sp.]|uniref:hypothetical protein n=1 Tax=uncultured Massilia sp. TaxID=169973 RepID=UPI0025F7EE60|nr:hypothetical protein [uncultured Massilia sp.]